MGLSPAHLPLFPPPGVSALVQHSVHGDMPGILMLNRMSNVQVLCNTHCYAALGVGDGVLNNLCAWCAWYV